MMESTVEIGRAIASPPCPPNARVEFGRAMIDAALPGAVLRNLLGKEAYGLVVVAPSSKHVDIIAGAFESIAGAPEVHCLDKPTRWEATELVDILAGGSPVLAVCSDLAQVPASFKALADEVVHVHLHDARILRKTLAKVLDGPVPRFGKRFIVHPDPDLVCRCIAHGLAPVKVVDALTRLGELCRPRGTDRLPDLDRAVEFGEARSWGLRIRSDLAAWRAGKLDAADLDTSALLVSPPGHGKTMFARVLAKGLGVPLIEIKLGDLFVREGHLGDVITELRERFSAATAAAPAVLLLDELDSLGRRDERDKNSSFKTGLINELLTMLDGAGQRRPGLVVIGATNAPQAIDPAMRRPGRLGRTIELEPPGPDGIANVLRFHLRGDLRGRAIDEVVRLSGGSTPAELMDLVRRARQYARSEDRPLDVYDLLAQTTEYEPIDWELMRRVSIHEAGHALACLLLPEAPRLHSVSILEAGSTMGRAMTARLPGAMTKARLEAQVMVSLAGRAAEALVYGDADPSDGATGDLETATSILCRMHASWGMCDSLLHVADPEELLLTDASFAKRIGAELDRLMAAVTAELSGREIYLHEIAFNLCARHTLSGRDVAHVIDAVNAAVDGSETEGRLPVQA